MRVTPKRLLLLGSLCALILGIDLWPRSAAAEDACSSLFLTPSPHLSPSSHLCDVGMARAYFHSKVTPQCSQAARSGQAHESMEHLFSFSQVEGPPVPCDRERRQLALYALCSLRPPKQLDHMLKAITSSFSGNDNGQDVVVVSECILAVLELDKRRRLSEFVEGPQEMVGGGTFRSEVLERVASHAQPELGEQFAPILRIANAQQWMGRDRLHELVCRRYPVTSPELKAECGQTTGHEEARVRYVEVNKERQRYLALRLGLTAMSIGLAGLQLGLAIPYRDQLPGQIVSVIGGVSAGAFATFDTIVMLDPPHNTGLQIPGGLLGFAIAFPTVFIMALAGAGGGAAAYFSAQNPTGVIVSSSLSAAFSLASAIGITWEL